MGQKIGIGCLIVLVIFFVFGLSCTRACFRSRRTYRYRRSGSLVRLVQQQSIAAQLARAELAKRTTLSTNSTR
jgi:uncharacterized membrane protein